MCKLQENQFKGKEENCKIGLGTETNWNWGGGGGGGGVVNFRIVR